MNQETRKWKSVSTNTILAAELNIASSPGLQEVLDLYIIFDNSFLIGGGGFMNSCDFCLKLHLSFNRAEAFLGDLKWEYEVFKRSVEDSPEG